MIERDPEVWLVVETIGGCGAALDMVRRSLQAGKHVVTANQAADRRARRGAVPAGAGKPRKSAVRGFGRRGHPGAEPDDALPRREPHHIGERHSKRDDDYILTRMLENGESYDAALRAAQEKGYAEADRRRTSRASTQRAKRASSRDWRSGRMLTRRTSTSRASRR